MTEDLRDVLLGLVAAGISATLAWIARTYLWRVRLRRRQQFLGLPDGSDALLVINRQAGGNPQSVQDHDVYALSELSALVKECGARITLVTHTSVRQGIGEDTEFCLGGPVSNQRMAAHLQTLLPGVRVNAGLDPSEAADQCVFQIGQERYPLEIGTGEYVLLARLVAQAGARPVFLFCGQVAITNQAATRYLARHLEQLARKHKNSSFCLLLKVTNSDAYGPDMTELVADVTHAAQTPLSA